MTREEFERRARLVAAQFYKNQRELDRNSLRGVNLSRTPFSIKSFVQGALWAFDRKKIDDKEPA